MQFKAAVFFIFFIFSNLEHIIQTFNAKGRHYSGAIEYTNIQIQFYVHIQL